MDPEVMELNAHAELCANQAYCLNGGTCYLLSALGRLYCQCADSFEGDRCHMKTVGFPDYDTSIYYEKLLSWNGLLPIAIVVAVTILFMVVLFFVFVCAKKCHQTYRVKKSPVKVPRYRNASVQTSGSQLHLLDTAAAAGTTLCNGQLGASALITASRTRLPACSTTPDNADDQNSLHDLHQSSGRSCVDIESGSCSERDLLEGRGHASTRPCIVLTESEATEARRHSRRGGTNQTITDASIESTSTGFQRETNRQGASAPCLSPNDSNNNKDVFACNSSRCVTDLATVARGNCDERTTLLQHPGNSGLDKYSVLRDSHDSTNNKATNSEPEDLYDSDPEATAL